MVDIMIDPDGTLGLEIGLLVIVQASTGVVYHHQCGGYATLENQVEGFLIPISGPLGAKRIYDWFWQSFAGNCYQGSSDWSPAAVAQLRHLVAEFPVWCQGESGMARSFLELDEARIDQCVEAWIPVRTPYGSGIMILGNSD